MPVDKNKVKRCKDCDPNKYIEGLAYRGANGFNFDDSLNLNFGSEIIPMYNSLGDPNPNQTTFGINPNDPKAGLPLTADLGDLTTDYNPALRLRNVNNKVQSGVYRGSIKGIDRRMGFWFIWDFKDGMILRGSVGETIGPSKITSSAHIATQKGQLFSYTITSDSEVSYYYVSDSKNFDSNLNFRRNSTDPSVPSKTDILDLGDNVVSKVGYYTITLNTAILTGKQDKKKKPVTINSFKTLTITSKDSYGNDPIRATSNPALRVQNGSSVNYTITTNITQPNSNTWKATINSEGLSRLGILGLNFNEATKTISGTVQCPASIILTSIPISVSNNDESSGQISNFNLQIVSGTFTGTAPTISNQTFNFKVGTAVKQKIAAPNAKYFSIGTLPEGLRLDVVNGLILGTPKHAFQSGSPYQALCAVTNLSGVRSTATINFVIAPNETQKFTPSASYPKQIDMYSNPAFEIQDGKINVTLSTRSNEIIRFASVAHILQGLNISNYDTFAQNLATKGIGPVFGAQLNTIIPPISDGSKTILFQNFDSTNQRRFFVSIDDPDGVVGKYVPVTVEVKDGRGNTKRDQFGRVITKPKIDPLTGQVEYKFIPSAVKNKKGRVLDIDTSIDIDVVMNIEAGEIARPDATGRLCYTPPDSSSTESEGPTSTVRKRNVTLNIRDTNRLFTTTGINYILNKNVKKKKDGITLTVGAYYSNLPTETYQYIDRGDADFLIPDVYWSDAPLIEKNRNKNNTALAGDLAEDEDFEDYPGKIEYQAYYSAPTSYGGVNIPPQLRGEVALETTLQGISSPKKLKDNVTLKYPNGIPKKEGVYICRIIPHGICTFLQPQYQNITETFMLRLYSNPKDIAAKNQIYSCTYKVKNQRTNRPTNVTVQSLLGTNNQFNDVESVIPNSASCKATNATAFGKDYHIFPNYVLEYANNSRASEDIGITSLTNISLLDLVSEGPIEGIVDYEITPLAGNTEGMIGYENGVKITKYPGDSSIIRSVYWNETPLADETYPNNASLNFDFIKLSYTNGDKPSLHSRLQFHKDIDIKEEFYTKKLVPGENATDKLNIKQITRENNSTRTELIKDLDRGDDSTSASNLIIKVPKYISNTKTSGMRLPGARKIENVDEVRRYRKSINILSKNLYGLRLHIKTSGLFRQIVDLSIFESTNQAAAETTSGRIDRYAQLYYLRLKRIDSSINNGQKVYYVTQSKSGGNYVITPANLINPDNYQVGVDTWVLKIVGKFNQGGLIESFEWIGLDKIPDSQNAIGWEIEITPVHYESVDINVVNKANVDSITEIYSDKLVYPNTAAVLTTFDARFFQSIPQRAFDTRLLKVKIPSNYDPYSRTYQGTWDGTFHLGWTDNPAWCFYDMLTNNRFGLGKYFDSQYVDKWTLYEISKYCDGLVKAKRSNTQGSNEIPAELEPRFTCNLLLSTREDAYKVLNDMASIFRAIVYYNAGLIFTAQDKPKEPVYLFNNSNVKEGEFTYSNTSKRVRRNVVLVRYNDKFNFYKPAIKYVENRDGVLRYGIKEMEISAFGCTSESQAERLGKWALLSENSESELVSFETSLPALYLKPGDVIFIQDQNRQNKILGGRTYQLTKDFAILDVKYDDISEFLPAIGNFNFNVLTPAGNLEIGTPTGNFLMDKLSENPSSFNENVNVYLKGEDQNIRELSSQLIRRKQVQTIPFSAGLANIITLETGINYSGYAKINFNSSPLDNVQHTLLQNTVWTIEIDPVTYDVNKSPSIKSDINSGVYQGKSLEPYIDQTQKFRVLDIEEVEEHRYKISALQYDEAKFAEADRI